MKDNGTTPENHIHLASSHDLVHVAKRVYLNGIPLLLTEDGVDIAYGFNEPTVVTLKVLAKTVTFGGDGVPKDAPEDANFRGDPMPLDDLAAWLGWDKKGASA